jgi:large repetitive protein
MTSSNRLRAVMLCISWVVAWVAPWAAAQSPSPSSRIALAVDETARVTLKGTTPKAVETARDLGTIEGGRPLQRMMLVLTPSSGQQAALQRLIDDQHQPGSAQYHNWLTPEQFAANFGPSDDDLAKIKGWLRSHGLNPTGVGRGRQWIEFSGTAQQVNAAFRTSMHRFEANGRTYISNSSDVSIPAALNSVVGGVLSLNNFRAHPAHTHVANVKRSAQGDLARVAPQYTTTNGNGTAHYLAPGDFQRIYDIAPLLKRHLDGTGISIAIVGRTDIYLTDVQAFRQAFGLPQNDPNFIVNGPDPGMPDFDDLEEASLDVEWAGAVAPGARIDFVTSASTDTTDGIELSSVYIVDNALSPIMSVSYGLCEALMGPAQNQFYNALWRQAAAEGITVLVATGDSGAAQCDGDLQRANLEPQGPALNGATISGMSSTPYNVAVGGTQFDQGNHDATFWSSNNSTTFESALGYIPEQIWNESCDPTLPQTGTNCVYGQTSYNLEGGGGGSSSCSQSSVDDQGNVTCIAGYPKPSWQKGRGVPADGVRDTPDLSLSASPDDDGYLFCAVGSCKVGTSNGQTVLEQAGVVGGTSASTPAMAGIMALVEQKNGAFQGQANYVFYKLAAMDADSSCNASGRTNPAQPSSCNFNDITAGSNSVPGLPGYDSSTTQWSAGPGYDRASGLGSVNAANLVANWGKISRAGSRTELLANTAGLYRGQPLAVEITVAPENDRGPVPTGAVALVTDQHVGVGAVSLDANGRYSGQVNNLPGGTYKLFARYGGDGNFDPSVSEPVTVSVAPKNSTISVQLSMFDPTTNKTVPYSGTPQYGYGIYFSVQVSGPSGSGSPSGVIRILNGNNVVLTSPLNSSGTAYISTGYGTPYTFPTGANTVSVEYLGDHSFNPSTSSRMQLNIGKQQVLTEVGISAYDVPAGQPVFITGGLVSGYSPAGFPYAVFSTSPTGTMQFYDDGVPMGPPVAIVSRSGNPEAPYTATLSKTGVHNITASYSGDSNYAAVSQANPNNSISSFNIVPATGAATVTTVVQTPAAVTFGQSFTYTVTVTPATKGGPVPTGEVWIAGREGFFDNTITLVNGQGSVTEQPGAGTDQLYAQYLGDSHYAPSTSAMFTTTVRKLTTQLSLTTTTPWVASGQQATLNFVVSGYSYGQGEYYEPGGTVQWFTSVDGGAARAITAALGLGPVQNPMDSGLGVRVNLPPGINVVTARYSGDFYMNGGTSAPVTVVVNPWREPE